METAIDLEKLFHEPSRLAIMSQLLGEVEGISFSELKSRTSMTDGNLSRHLSILEKAKAIKIKKTFVGVKPRTTVTLSDKGRGDFINYLDALEKVLSQASKRIKAAERTEKSLNSKMVAKLKTT